MMKRTNKEVDGSEKQAERESTGSGVTVPTHTYWPVFKFRECAVSSSRSFHSANTLHSRRPTCRHPCRVLRCHDITRSVKDQGSVDATTLGCQL